MGFIKILVLMLALLFIVTLYAMCIAAKQADEEAERMIQEHTEKRHNDTDCPWK